MKSELLALANELLSLNKKELDVLKNLNEAQSESLSDRDNEQKENNCLLNLPKGDCVTKNSFKYCPVSCRWRQL